MAATTIECEDVRWPLCVCAFSGKLDDRDFDRYLAFLAHCHERREVWGLVIDACAVRSVSAQQRRRMADFLKTHEVLARRYCAGTAFVIDSPLARGTLTAIFWFQRQPTPYIVVAQREQATSWLAHQIDAYKSGRPTLPPLRAAE